MISTLKSCLLLSFGITVLQYPFTLAADCYGDKGQHPDEAFLWDLRQSMCGDNGCALSDADAGNNEGCTLTMQIRNRTVARAHRDTTTGVYAFCWDALGNAIAQCFRDTSEDYTGEMGVAQGRVAEIYGENYWIHIVTSDEFTINEPEVVEGREDHMDEVDNDPETPGRDYLWGPNRFCMSTGRGSQTCLDIAEGCYVLSPIDNTVPRVICG